MMSDSIKAFDKVLADLQEIKIKGDFLPDCATKKGYEASKNYVLKVTTPARTALTAAHKDAKAFYLSGGKSVDNKKNELMQMLIDVQAPHQAAYKAVDDEKKRIKEAKEAAIQYGYDLLRGYASKAINQPSSFINDLIDDCGSFDADPNVYGKQIEEVTALHHKIMGQLTDAMTQALQFEELKRQQDEITRKQAEIDEKERKQKEAEQEQEKEVKDAIQREEMRKEAEQAAEVELNQSKFNAEHLEALMIDDEINQKERGRVERIKSRIQMIENCGRGFIGDTFQPIIICLRELNDKIIIDDRYQEFKQHAINAKNAAIENLNNAQIAADAKSRDDENKRLAGIETAKQEQDRLHQDEQKAIADEAARLEDNRYHSRKVKTIVLDFLVAGGVEPEQAKLVVKLAASRKNPHIQINY